MKRFITLTLFAVTAGFAHVAEAADIDGQWARGDGNAKVRISPCGSDISVVNTWIKPGCRRKRRATSW